MKKLITKEVVAEVNEMLKQSEIIFKPCDIFPGFCVRLGNVVIRKVGNSSIIELDPSVKKEAFDLWKKDVGKYLSKDLYHGIYTNLFELCTPDKKVLLRKVSQEELPEVRSEGYNHVYIGDYYYTILKIISADGSYLDIDKTVENIDNEDFSQYSYISNFNKTDKTTEEEEMQQGISLFNENEVSSDIDLEPIAKFDDIVDDTIDETIDEDIN